MADAARLAADNPDITFVLQHAGMLEDLSPEGRAAWRDGMKRLADEQNIVIKLSGLGTFIHRNDPAHIADIVLQTVEMFGARALPVRQQFPDREAVDELCRSRRRASRRGRLAAGADQQAILARHRDARLPTLTQPWIGFSLNLCGCSVQILQMCSKGVRPLRLFRRLAKL